MGLIVKKLKVMGDRGEKMVDCLFDIGASVSFIRKDVSEKIATTLLMHTPMVFSLGDGRRKLEAKEITPLQFEMEDYIISDEAIIVDNLAEEMIIGAGTMQKWRIKLDLEHDDIIWTKRLWN